jgi:hypothetical protein
VSQVPGTQPVSNARQQAANIRADLGLAARAQGDLDETLILLEAARGGADATTQELIAFASPSSGGKIRTARSLGGYHGLQQTRA